MAGRGLAVLGGVLLVSVGASAWAEPREYVVPERNDDRATRQSTWIASGSWLISPPVLGSGEGDRVSALMSSARGSIKTSRW